MKRLCIVLFISCFLLLSNATIAIGFSPSKVSIKTPSTTVTPENIDKPLVDETGTAQPIQESKPTLETSNGEQITSQNEKVILKTREQVIPGHEEAFLYPANAHGPYSGYVGQQIQFSGSSQYLLFTGATYSWDFNGDGIYDWSSTYNGITTHTYSKPGKYLATFKVTKNDGKTYIDMAPVDVGIVGENIDNSHLQPRGGYCYYGVVGEPILFDASQSTSTDPNHPITRYIWHFGDGTVGYGKKVYHTYNEAIPYMVQLETRDGAGNKRFDVLHADIDCKLSKYDDFLATSNQLVQDILSFITDSRIFFYLLDVKVVTNYNGNIIETQIPDGDPTHFPKTIEVGPNAEIQINHISLFKYENPTISDFTGMTSHTWKSTFSASLSNINQDDNFTVLLQFSFGSWIASQLGIEEPKIQIGYKSKSGELKPTGEFTISHIFRPYLLERLGLNGNSQNNENEEPYEYNLEQATTYSGYTQAYSSEQMQTSDYETSPAPIGNAGMQQSKSEQTPQIEATQQTLYAEPLDSTDFYPEQEVKFENMDADHFSLVIAFSNNYVGSKTEFNLSFNQFVDSTIKSKRFQDVGFDGYEQSGDTSLTLTISREANGRRAKLGLIIDPIQNFMSHVEYTKSDTGVCTLSLNIDNPPENLVLFTESEDSWGEYKSNYFYLENIPSSLTFDILPRLEDGYISITKETGGEFKVGIKNDLKTPSINLYLTHPSLQQTRIDWQLLSSPHSINLNSATAGLSLNAEIKDLTQKDQLIEFHGTLQDDINLEVEWSFKDGYISVKKSVTTVDFVFSYTQNDINLMVDGNYIGGTGEGFTVDFDGFGDKGLIEIDTGKEIFLHVFGKKSTAFLITDIDFSSDGHMKLEWDQHRVLNVDATRSLAFKNLEFNSPDFTINADNISFGLSSSFNLDLTDTQLEIAGENQVELSGIEVETKYWSGTIGNAKSRNGFCMNLDPYTKYYSLAMNQLVELENFNIVFDGSNDQFDTDFSIGNLYLINNGIIWFDFSASPEFELSTQYQTSTLSLEDLHLAIGPQNSRLIDFTISSFNLNGGGLIHSEFNSQHFYVAASISFGWNIDLTTLNYGNWNIDGTYSGSGTIDITEWQPGLKGQVVIGVNSPINHSLKITHGQLELELGDITLNPVLTPSLSTINWKREQLNSNGYFNITSSGIMGSATLCKLTYNNTQDPFEFELGNISVKTGDISLNWQRQTDQKMLYINNGLTIDLALVKLRWSNKILTVGDLGLTPGQFKITIDTSTKTITLKNGMTGLGPLCSYEDADRKLSVDLLNLVNDYSKTMTLKWYQDSNNKITGLYLDTDDTNLVDWIVFESIRYATSPSDITGRRIALGGFQADDFKIMKNATSGKLDIEGRLYLANHFTYSKLYDYQTNQWKDLDVQWDLNLDGVGNIELNTDPGFDEDMKLSTTLAGGAQIEAAFDLPEHIKFGWDVDFDGQGNVTIDTDYQEIIGISFEIQKDTTQYQPKWGFYIGAAGLRADDYEMYWDFSGSPGDWVIGSTGEIESGSIINDLCIAWKGQWYNLLLNGEPTQR